MTGGRVPQGEEATPSGWWAPQKPALLRHCVECGNRLNRYRSADVTRCHPCDRRRYEAALAARPKQLPFVPEGPGPRRDA